MKKHKPHIRKVNGYWECSLGSLKVIGSTPQKAYENLLETYLYDQLSFPVQPTAIQGGVIKEPCLWDSLPESERGKPYGMVCFCPKCSVRC